jgi:S1-C subfamily serine protease
VSMKEEDGKVVVEGVMPGSTADRAGVLAGDVIISMGEVVIEDSFDLVYEVNQRVSGDQAALIVEREGKQINLDVTFAPLPKTDEHGMGKHRK